MPKWEDERRKVWGLILELKDRVKELEKDKAANTKSTEQPAKRAEA